MIVGVELGELCLGLGPRLEDHVLLDVGGESCVVGKDDDRVVIITLTQKGRELQEQAKDIPEKVGSCIDLPIEKARALYDLLYELLENQKGQNKR